MSDLIIVPTRNGQAQTGIVHLPQPFFDNIPDPYEWAARCGGTGIVYARRGVFENAEICRDCAGAPPDVSCGPDASRARYVEGCRCVDCRRANRDWQRRYMAENGDPCPDCGGVKSYYAVRCQPCAALARTKAVAHGTNAGYARSCRCSLCVEAHSLRMAEWRRRRAA